MYSIENRGFFNGKPTSPPTEETDGDDLAEAVEVEDWVYLLLKQATDVEDVDVVVKPLISQDQMMTTAKKS